MSRGAEGFARAIVVGGGGFDPVSFWLDVSAAALIVAYLEFWRRRRALK